MTSLPSAARPKRSTPAGGGKGSAVSWATKCLIARKVAWKSVLDRTWSGFGRSRDMWYGVTGVLEKVAMKWGDVKKGWEVWWWWWDDMAGRDGRDGRDATRIRCYR